MTPALTLLRESRQIETRASYFGDMRACLCSLLAVALVGCHASQYHSSQTRSSYGLRAARVEQDVEFDCLHGLETVKASLRCEAKGGPASWSLVDPAGTERWSGTISGSLNATQRFEPIPGIWRLRFTAEDYTGYYALEVCGRGGARLIVKPAAPATK